MDQAVDALRAGRDPSGRAEERKIDRPWKRRTDRGYPEYCAVMLDASAPPKVYKRARHEMMRILDQARGRKIFDRTNNGVEAIAKAVTGSRKGEPRRSASRPRSGHK